MRFTWTSMSGDIGSLFVENGVIALRLSEDPNEDDNDDADPVSVAHWLPIPTARALHEALGRAIAEVDSTPAPSRYEGDDDNPECSQDDYEAMTYITDSISATLAACAAPVPNILRKIDAACEPPAEGVLFSAPRRPMSAFTPDSPMSADVLIEQMRADLRRLADVYSGTLASVTDEELAQRGMRRVPDPCGTPATPGEHAQSLKQKPSHPLPKREVIAEHGKMYVCDGTQAITITLPTSDTLNRNATTREVIDGAKGATLPVGQSFRFVLDGGAWKMEDDKPSHPEPPPTGNGDLVTPSLLEALADYPELAALVSARDAFGRSKYGTGLRTHNGRDPLEDARQELGDLLQYVWQAKMEGLDIHPFLDLWSSAYTAVLPSDEQYERVRRNMLEYVEAVRDVTTGSKPESRARAEKLYATIKQDMLEGDPRMGTVQRLHEMMGPAPTLHPRPFFWESNMCHGPVNCPEGTWGNRMTLEQLLQYVPNALDGKETHHKQEPGCPPIFGFRLEHDGSRTLREYLEEPDAAKTA